jgi:hypothetical protein
MIATETSFLIGAPFRAFEDSSTVRAARAAGIGRIT